MPGYLGRPGGGREAEREWPRMLVMDMSAARPIRLGCFDVRDGYVVVADEALPLAVEVDGVSGQVARVFAWPVLPELRDRPMTHDVLVLGESIMISSPAAGGIVVIDRGSGQVTVISLEADAGTLTACGDAVWAVAGPGWYRPGPGGPRADGGGRTRPVAWEEPTAAEIARDEEHSRRSALAGRPRPADLEVRTVADLRQAEGDNVILGPATPVWHIRAGAARRIDADLEAPRLAAVAGTIVAACQLPGDPLIKHVGPGGLSVHYRSPGTIIALDDTGTVQDLGKVPSTRGVICEDRGRAWLLGFDSEIGDPAGGVRELLLAQGRIGGSLDLRLQNPAGIIDGLVADLSWQVPARDPAAPPSAAVRFLPVAGGDPAEVPLPGLEAGAEAKVRDGQVWAARYGDAVLRVITPGDPAARELRVTLDCQPWITPPQPPPGLELARFEQGQLDRFRGELGSTRVDEQSRVSPLIEGLSFDAIELRGTFPGSQLVALFHATTRPGIQYGLRRRLYDDLGNPIRHQYAHIYLAEDIATAGLPPSRQCVPDAAGVVWL
jgi:hypothetical protein